MTASTIGSYKFNKDRIPITVLYKRHYYLEKKLVLHDHEFIELVVVCGGKAIHQVLVDGKITTSNIERGSIFLVNLKESHFYEVQPGEYIDIINVLFDPSVLNQFIYQNNLEYGLTDFLYLLPKLPSQVRFENIPILEAEQHEKIVYLINLLKDEGDGNMAGSLTIKLFLLTLIISYAGRAYTKRTEAHGIKHADKDPNILRIIGFMEQNYMNDITLENMAKISMYSKRHLTRQFKESTGKTISDYLQNIRVNKVCSLLTNTDINIEEISFLTGFRNSSYLHRVFKNIKGVTPGQYRRKHFDSRDLKAETADIDTT